LSTPFKEFFRLRSRGWPTHDNLIDWLAGAISLWVVEDTDQPGTETLMQLPFCDSSSVRIEPPSTYHRFYPCPAPAGLNDNSTNQHWFEYEFGES
jgi:hypothetical protein